MVRCAGHVLVKIGLWAGPTNASSRPAANAAVGLSWALGLNNVRVLKAIREKLAARAKPPEPPITLTPSGFLAGASRGPATEVHWQSIAEVRAFKLDLLTWDEVRFIFILSSGTAVEISEEQPGFEAMLTEAMKHMPSLVDWQSSIIKPAFARNETVLFQRQAQQGIQPDGPASGGSAG